MAKYTIQDTTLQGIADAIRGKTGTADPIAVSAMAAQIADITEGSGISPEAILENYPVQLSMEAGSQNVTAPEGSYIKSAIIQKPDTLIPENILEGVNIAGVVGTATGGTDQELCYVTFMNHDGTAQLYQRAVIPGNDCGNVVEIGLLEAPAKESTAQHDFTFSGWTTTPGGSKEDTALKNVTTDRTVYAAYATRTRLYTVRFFDGDTLLTAMQVAYGESANFTIEKEGYQFEGWVPSNLNITADTDCYAQWATALTFANGTWEQINEVCQQGEADYYFGIGDTKTIVGTDNAAYVLRIIGLNLDTKADGSGKAGITVSITKPDEIAAASGALYDGNQTGFWETTAARSYLQNTFMQILPADLQSVIKTVTKTSDHSVMGLQTKTSTDTLFIPSYHELEGGSIHSGSSETIVYPWYAESNTNRKLYDDAGSAATAWTRTMNYSSSQYLHCYIDKYGRIKNLYEELNTAAPTEIKCFPICFCI